MQHIVLHLYFCEYRGDTMLFVILSFRDGLVEIFFRVTDTLIRDGGFGVETIS